MPGSSVFECDAQADQVATTTITRKIATAAAISTRSPLTVITHLLRWIGHGEVWGAGTGSAVIRARQPVVTG